MYLPKFTLERPASSEEAATLLMVKENAGLVAGGTELFPRMKYGLSTPDVLVSLKGLRPSKPETTGEGILVLDANLSLTAVNESAEIRRSAPLLAMAAGKVATREIRNMGTLGGNLCQETRCLYYNQSHTFQFKAPCFKRGGTQCYFIPKGNKCWAVYMSDTSPALLCLDARMTLVGGKGEREIGVETLYTHDPLHPFSLTPYEIVTKVMIPQKQGPMGYGFAKFSIRGGLEFAAVNVAVLLEGEDDFSTCSRARIAVGAVSDSPQRALEVEALLNGSSLSDDLIHEASQKISRSLKIVPHHGYSKAFLAECLKSQTREALTDAAKMISDRK